MQSMLHAQMSVGRHKGNFQRGGVLPESPNMAVKACFCKEDTSGVVGTCTDWLRHDGRFVTANRQLLKKRH